MTGQRDKQHSFVLLVIKPQFTILAHHRQAVRLRLLPALIMFILILLRTGIRLLALASTVAEAVMGVSGWPLLLTL